MTKAASDPNSMLQVFLEIGIIEQLVSNLFQRAMPDGMTVSQFSVLNHLVRLGDQRTPLEIARAFQVTKGAMTNTLQKLEGRGLIRLDPDPTDGRSKRVSLTRAGRGMRRRCIRSLGPIIKLMAQELDLGELIAMQPALEGLRKYLDDNRDLHERAARRDMGG